MNSSFTQSILVFHSFPSCFAMKGVFGVLTDFMRAGAIGIPMFCAGKTVQTQSPGPSSSTCGTDLVLDFGTLP
jgi:hypothetical protein